VGGRKHQIGRRRSGRHFLHSCLFACLDCLIMNPSLSAKQLRGKFISPEIRKEAGREIARTHFHLGDAQSDYTTTAKRTFPATEYSPPPPPAETRASTLSLSDQVTKGFQQETEMRTRYLPYNIAAKLPGESDTMREDLTKHHFKLGSLQGANRSTSQSVFTPQLAQLDTQQIRDIEKLKQTIRTHANIFGSERFMTEGLSHTQYTPKTGNSAEAAEIGVNHRKRNQSTTFKIGSSASDFQSVTSRDFPKQAASPVMRSSIPQTSSGVQLGTDKNDHKSQSQTMFTAFPPCRQGISEETQKELQKSHFSMGCSPPQFTSTSRELLRASTQAAPLVKWKADYRKCNFVLGADSVSYKTTYGDKYLPKSPDLSLPQRDRNSDKKSNFALGSGTSPSPASVTRSDFKPFTGAEPNKLPEAITADIRQHHFQVGSDSRDWALASQRYGERTGVPAFLSEERRRDITAAHFQYGFSPAKYQTTSHSPPPAYGRNQLDAGTLKRLKGTNTYLGSSTGDYETTHQASFLWVQPEADSDYQLTMK